MSSHQINEGSWEGYAPKLNICLKRKNIQCNVYLYYRHKSCASYCYFYCNLHISLNRSLWLSFAKIKQTKRVSEVFCKKFPLSTEVSVSIFGLIELKSLFDSCCMPGELFTVMKVILLVCLHNVKPKPTTLQILWNNMFEFRIHDSKTQTLESVA